MNLKNLSNEELINLFERAGEHYSKFKKANNEYISHRLENLMDRIGEECGFRL